MTGTGDVQYPPHVVLFFERLLTAWLAEARDAEIVPAASEALRAGTRLPVEFGGELAAWVGMPQDAKSSEVYDAAAFLEWVEQNYPWNVEERLVLEGDPTELKEVQELLARRFAKVHVKQLRSVYSSFAGTVRRNVAAHGGHKTKTDKIIEVPGVRAKTRPGTPTVTMEGNARDIVARFWHQINWRQVLPLALPAPAEAAVTGEAQDAESAA
jgi:hypothetical protein